MPISLVHGWLNIAYPADSSTILCIYTQYTLRVACPLLFIRPYSYITLTLIYLTWLIYSVHCLAPGTVNCQFLYKTVFITANFHSTILVQFFHSTILVPWCALTLRNIHWNSQDTPGYKSHVPYMDHKIPCTLGYMIVVSLKPSLHR